MREKRGRGAGKPRTLSRPGRTPGDRSANGLVSLKGHLLSSRGTCHLSPVGTFAWFWLSCQSRGHFRRRKFCSLHLLPRSLKTISRNTGDGGCEGRKGSWVQTGDSVRRRDGSLGVPGDSRNEEHRARAQLSI